MITGILITIIWLLMGWVVIMKIKKDTQPIFGFEILLIFLFAPCVFFMGILIKGITGDWSKI